MKKNITIIIILLGTANINNAQDTILESTRHGLVIAKNDTGRVLALIELCDYYKVIKPDSALVYGYKALTLARSINFPTGEVRALETLIITQLALGNYSKAFQLNFQGKRVAEKNNLKHEEAILMFQRAGLYEKSKDYIKALSLSKEAKQSFDSLNDSYFSAFTQMGISDIYYTINQLDSALHYAQLAHNKASQIENNWVTPYTSLSLGKVHQKLYNTDTALWYFNQSLSKAFYDKDLVSDCYLSIARLYQQTAKTDSAVFYGRKSFDLARQSGLYTDIINASLFLSNVYEKDDTKQSLYYSKQAITYKDSLSSIAQSTTQEAFTDFDEQERQQEIENAKTEFQNRSRTNIFLGITFTLLIIVFFLFRSSRLKQRSKQNIEKAYDQLKSTQAQLIQSEKMASLGELTAGIAHEIQNPLNFVNNFSEVNKEMIVELKEEINKGNYEDAKFIANDIAANEEKINHHGKRAEAIVKGMLQHSRKSEGTKELTDINALCDEYLRLSYHGLRAKDKNFNADFKTEFDESIGKINIVPQDIGRVLLNLYNNACYAVNENNKEQPENYDPTVSVSTKLLTPPSGDGGKILISVKDNGNGIPQNIINKIFQPFFTTKPTGQGTGLGLSLAYDIITKQHNGTIKVESKEGEGTSFIIQLPIS